jgi:hypothetical protein
LTAPNTLVNSFSNFDGLDLRSSDILRKRTASTSLLNMQYRQTGAMTKRKGWQVHAKANGGYGLHTFRNVNINTGSITEETVTIDDELHKIVSNSFTITYTGSTTATYSMYLNASNNEFVFEVKEGTTVVLTESLGTGLEGTPVTVSTLVTAINALTDFSAGTITAGGSEAAAFISQETAQSISASGTLVGYNTVTAIDLPGTYTKPFATFFSKKTDSEFENASFAQINDIMYIATGYDALHKYDGTRLYKAGLPKATAPTLLAASTGASFTAGRKLAYRIETEHTDAKGNLIYSEISDIVEVTVDGSGNSINVTYTELLASSGYDTDSSNLKYNIFRSDESADYSAATNSLFYLIHTASHGDTIPYEDAGDALGAQFVEPIKQRGLPPQCKYIDTWRAQIVMSGSAFTTTTENAGVANDVTINTVDTVYYSDIDSPEYFPEFDNSFKSHWFKIHEQCIIRISKAYN